MLQRIAIQLAGGVLTVMAVASASAQPAEDRPAPSATATLPESNEALLISSRIRSALQNQDYALAFRLLEGYPRGGSELVAIPASETYQPVWREAWRLYGETPPAGVELYRRLREEATRARFEEASRNADIPTLRTLFRTERLCAIWPRIARDFATLLVESGRYPEAIEALRLLHREQPNAPDLQAQLAVTLALAGADDAARRALTAEGEPNDPRLGAVRAWLGQRARGAVGGTAPLLNAPAEWSADVPAPADVDIDDAAAIAHEVEYWRRLPLIEPVVGADTLVFRLRGNVYAFDALTLLPRWVATERAGEIAGDASEMRHWSQPESSGWSANLSDDTRALLTAHLQHTLAADDQAVYSIESIFESAPDIGFMRRPRPDARSNDLVARRLTDGALLWRKKASDVVTGRVAAFLDRPLVDGSRLLLPVRSDGDIVLAALSAATGEVTRTVNLVGPPTRLPDGGGYCLISADQSHVYVATGNGVIAALGFDDLDWRWATTYESSLSQQLTVRWAPPPVTDESAIDRPVLAGDMLVVAPIDSRRRSPDVGEAPEVLFIDRFEGRLRWRIPRQDIAFLIGGGPAGLIVGGATIRCLDLGDPSGPPVWETPPLRVSGRPALQGNRVYVPTREGMIAVDAASGRIVADQRFARSSAEARLNEALPEGLDRAASNVIASAQGLFVVAPDRVIKYADPIGVAAAIERRGEGGPGDPSLAYARGWLRFLRGDEQGVLEELAAAPAAADSQMRSASAELRVNALLRLSQQASVDDERLRWLQEAAAIGDSPRSGEVAIALGAALERAERIDDAVNQYLQVIISGNPDLISDSDDGSLFTAPWLIAARRLHALRETRDAEIDIEAALADAEVTPAALMRLLEAIDDEAQRRMLRVRLTLSAAPPELVVGRLATADEAPPAARRAVQMRRWEVAVALGDLTQAALERSEWTRVAAATEPPTDIRGKLLEEDGLDSIQIATLKLEQSRGVPFSRELARQWELTDSELVIDPRNITDLLRPWKLIRNHRAFTLALHRCDSSGPALSVTADGLSDARSQRQSIELGRERETRPAGATFATVWTSAVHGRLAATPVRGGLICVGLGPERDGGQRLWEIAKPDIPGQPERFERLSATVDAGLALVSEADVVEMRDWTDGEIRWRRRFAAPVVSVQSLGADIVALTRDNAVRLMRGADGGDVRVVDVGAAIRRVETYRDSLLVWSGGDLSAINRRSGAALWTREDVFARFTPVIGADWVIVSDDRGEAARLIDLQDGADVFEEPLRDLGVVTAAAVSGDRLLVAGLTPNDEDDVSGEPVSLVRLSIYATMSGELVTAPEVKSFVPVTEAQLVASEDYVPLLRVSPSEPEAPGFGIRSRATFEPRIVLIDKRSGDVLDDVVKRDQQPAAVESVEFRLIATPTRVLVQVGDHVYAYGISSLSRAP